MRMTTARFSVTVVANAERVRMQIRRIWENVVYHQIHQRNNFVGVEHAALKNVIGVKIGS
jgi:glycerol-3-phosphate dehydrogenase